MLDNLALLFWAIAGLWLAMKFIKSVQLVPTQSAVIVERLGNYSQTLLPGFHLLIPFLDRVAYVHDLKEESMEVPPQDCFTKDNVQVEVDGILYMSVKNPVNASYGVTDYRFAAIQLAQTTTRSVIGTLELDRTFEERDIINSRVLSALGEVAEGWGIEVHRYEVKSIVPPASVKDAMERQMNAERERRALLARAEGEKLTRVNESEGLKQEMINRSEGEMRRRINEAEGRAAEILALASATAESIRKIGGALADEGGADAARMRLAQQYIQRLSALAREGTEVVLSADLTSLDNLLEGIDITEAAKSLGNAPAVAAKPLPPSAPRAQLTGQRVVPASESADTQPALAPVKKPTT